MNIKHLQAVAIGSLLLCLPVFADAQMSRQKVVGVRIRSEQGSTQPITLRSVNGPNTGTNNPTGIANWILEIKASATLLAAGATVRLNVKQLGDPLTLEHKVAITQANTITFGETVSNGQRTASVTVPIEALGSAVGGVFSVNLQADAVIVEAQTNKTTTSTVTGTYNFLFPVSFNISGGGSPEPLVLASQAPRPPQFRQPWDSSPRLKLHMHDYYEWYTGYEPTQRCLNGYYDDDM